MSTTVLIGAALLGGFGAVLRFLLDAAVSTRSQSPFPLGTLAVNLTGSFALGFLVGAGVSGEQFSLLALGLLGSFTTFSTWMFETQRLAEDGRLQSAFLNIALSLFFGLLALVVGRLLGGLF
jgi:CrcB protein